MPETQALEQNIIYDVETMTLHSTQNYVPYVKEMLEKGWEFTHKDKNVKLPHGGYVDIYWFRRLKKQ